MPGPYPRPARSLRALTTRPGLSVRLPGGRWAPWEQGLHWPCFPLSRHLSRHLAHSSARPGTATHAQWNPRGAHVPVKGDEGASECRRCQEGPEEVVVEVKQDPAGVLGEGSAPGRVRVWSGRVPGGFEEQQGSRE